MITLDRIEPFKADRVRLSPNFGSRKGRGIKLIILHATADNGSEIGAENWLVNPASRASAHLHILRDGSVTRLVEDEQRAWHAGISDWPGIDDVNSESLGWEIANRNDGKEAYTDAQYHAVAELLRHYLPQGLDKEAVLSHQQVAPRRKTDPLGWDWKKMWLLVDGQTFDWSKVKWPEPEIVRVGLPEPDSRPIEIKQKEVIKVPVLPEAGPPEPTILARLTKPLRRVGDMAIVTAKPWWASKMLWFNGLTILLTILGLLQQVLPPEVAAHLATVVAGINFILRFFTDKPIASSEKPKTV